MLVDRRVEADRAAGEHRGRDRDDRRPRLNRSVNGVEPDAAPRRDRGDAGFEGGGQAGAEAGNEGAIAAGNPPVGPARRIVVGEEVGDRELVDHGAVHEAAQRVDEGTPWVAERHRVAGAVTRWWIA